MMMMVTIMMTMVVIIMTVVMGMRMTKKFFLSPNPLIFVRLLLWNTKLNAWPSA